MTFLADDAREGRAPGTKGIEAAAEYIAGVFRGAGLKPAAGASDYFEPFSIQGNPSLAGDQELSVTLPRGEVVRGTFNTDFGPLAIGTSAELQNAPIVFAGYGITALDPGRHFDYDDYAGISTSRARSF